MTRRPSTPPPAVTVRPVRNASIWGSDMRGPRFVTQWAIVCAPCGDRVISINVSQELAQQEAAQHATTHADQATAP